MTKTIPAGTSLTHEKDRVKSAAAAKVLDYTQRIIKELESYGVEVVARDQDHVRYGKHPVICKVGGEYVDVEFRERSEGAGRFSGGRYIGEFDVKVRVSFGRYQNYPETDRGLNVDKIAQRIVGLLAEGRARNNQAALDTAASTRNERMMKNLRKEVNGDEYHSRCKSGLSLESSSKYGVLVEYKKTFTDEGDLRKFVADFEAFMASRNSAT